MMGDSPVISVFGSSATTPDQAAWREARQLGRILAEAGAKVATGGYGGTMEAVSEGASAGGGEVIGITAPNVFPHRAGPNRFVRTEIPAHDIYERDRYLLGMASATITLPGSIGTIVEFSEAWREALLSPPAQRKPHVAVGENFRRLAYLMVTEFGVDPEAMICVSTASEAARVVLDRLGLTHTR
ncbi:MAG: DNA-binding protein [Acidimicrobiia bacterium]|nr:DNA-binding protein [Acidimicrobiia bacterium]MYJ15514.1 DNA-binding protein [Acidimicrobiia bacterium]